MFFCAISGEPPQDPVVSVKSGKVYERRLIVKYIAENGTDPVTGDKLEESDLEGKSSVRVIVGKGLHSVNQVPTLKPAVIREMQRQRIPVEVDSRNPGVLIVTVPPVASTSKSTQKR